MGFLRPALAGLLVSVCAASAFASTFAFGAATWRSDLSVDTSFGDDQASSQVALSTAASVNFRAQASADILGLNDSVADVQYVWDVPYTITRNVEVCCPEAPEATFPLQLVRFNISFTGAVGISQNPAGGNELARIFNGISVISLAGLFPPVSLNGNVRSNLDGVSPISRTAVADYSTSVNFSGPSAGEVSFALPADYRDWEDFFPPYAIDYSVPHTVVQSFTDTLRASFRVRAESLTDGFPFVAGEALACAGLLSTLDSFDTVPNCGNGLTVLGAVGDYQYTTLLISQIPEPGTLLLTGLGLAGLAALRRRRRA